MDERKKQILNIIIREHIKTGAPVGSGIIVDKYKLGVSSATVRNDMAELEHYGFIAQPHTSAGRIPTESAYQKYIENIGSKKLTPEKINEIKTVLVDNEEKRFKETAKVLAKLSNNAVFWAFNKDSLYYTGITNLLTQPEFVKENCIYNISAIIDEMDEIIADIIGNLNVGINVEIGTSSPFGEQLSSVMAKYSFNGVEGMLGIIGPIRMDYENNIKNQVYR